MQSKQAHPPQLKTVTMSSTEKVKFQSPCNIIEINSSTQDSPNLFGLWQQRTPLIVGNKSLPQPPLGCGGMSGQQQQERLHVTDNDED